MFSKRYVENVKINSSILEATVLESGNISEINQGIFRINQLTGNNLEPTAMNIFLRLENEGVHFTRMIGIGSDSKYSIIDNKVIYKGKFKDVKYSVVFTIVENCFFFDVKVNNENPNNKITIFYGMDTAVSNKFAVSNNESYVCQYVDHQAFETENGYVVCSRQNQGEHTYLEQGSIGKNVAYCTDGYQFFGTSYKTTNTPKALVEGKLPSQVYQYEFGYIGLQSEEFVGVGKHHICFYGAYQAEMSEVVTEPKLTSKVNELYNSLEWCRCGIEVENKLDLAVSFENVFNSKELSAEQLDKYFGGRKLEEFVDGKLQSFFMSDYSAVVLPSKELIMERPSGQVYISGNHFDFEEVMANTSYIYGLFTSQIVLGNTTFNKLSSNSRNSLNVQKISGQRMFVKIDGEYKLLCMPAVFQMGLNYAKWLYLINDDVLTVEVIINEATAKVTLNVKSENGVDYEYLLTNYLTMAPNEHESDIVYNIEGNCVKLTPAVGSMAHNHYPDLYFTIAYDKECVFGNDGVFYADGVSRGDTILTTKLSGDFTQVIYGSTFGKAVDPKADTLAECSDRYRNQFKELLNGFNLHIEGEEAENVDSFNYLAYWYTQNALVHFTSPHGLEQYNGAAWGTRDVCQGPAEYFMCTQHFDKVKDIILEVFKHQYIQNGNWPQWFMFDRYFRIQQHESHGDIIVWPMRLLGTYLEATKDYSILEEMVPYTDINTSEYIEEYSVLHHLENEVNNIVASFIDDTSLSCYGGGDWDDTLQPANKTYASRMVSGWTVALTYEALSILSRELKDVNPELANKYSTLCENIKADYNKYIIEDNVPAGFIHFTGNGIEKIIHPTDNKTNMKYRLLPFNRGIISELFTEEQKDVAIEKINKYLKHPDGVRLMDNTVPYKGGNNTYFTRAETAANFGREIGLQYCHAHIRYCEALAKIGDSKELYKGLLTIQPISVNMNVKNALPRQRHSYFSSSDGNFLNRYDAMANFHKLFTGEVGVKAGWRVYSSGPGIYLNQLITRMLGLRISGNNFVLDPVLQDNLNNLEFDYKICSKACKIVYKITGESKVVVNGKEVSFTREANAYRQGGYVVSQEHLTKENNMIEVYF